MFETTRLSRKETGFFVPQPSWNELQWGTAWVRCEDEIRRAVGCSREKRKPELCCVVCVLPAVVQQVRWKDGNEDVLPVHGEEHSVTRVDASCKLNKHTKYDVIPWLLKWMKWHSDSLCWVYCSRSECVSQTACWRKAAGDSQRPPQPPAPSDSSDTHGIKKWNENIISLNG